MSEKYKPQIAHVKNGKVAFWDHDDPTAPKLGPQEDGSHVGHFPVAINGKEIEPADREGLWRGDPATLAKYV